MQLYILRHGIAEEQSSAKEDSKRALTQEGVRRLREVLRLAEKADVFPAVVLSSPYLRATQTAEIAMDLLGSREPLVETAALVPHSDPESVWEEIRTHQEEDQVMLVGHEPLLSQLVLYLLGCPGLRIDLKKAALVRIDIEGFAREPRGILKWMLVPTLAG